MPRKSDTNPLLYLGERIKARLDALDISEREASRRAGFGLGYVGDLVQGRSKSPETPRLVRLAAVLECDLDYLLGEQPNPREAETRKRPFAHDGSVTAQAAGRMIALYAAPALSNDLWNPLLPKAVDKIPVPPSLVHVEDAYAFAISTSHMEPRYFPGEVVHINPTLAARAGDFVFVKKANGRAGVCRLMAIDGDNYRFGFLSGEECDKTRDDIDFIHRIVGSAG